MTLKPPYDTNSLHGDDKAKTHVKRVVRVWSDTPRVLAARPTPDGPARPMRLTRVASGPLPQSLLQDVVAVA